MNKNDLVYFEKLLNERKSNIKKNINDALSDMQHLRNNSKLSDESDKISIDIDKNIKGFTSKQQSEELKEIEYALFKIKNSTYGICEMCEEAILIQRLKAKPYARYCITCRELVEKDLNKRI